MEKKENEILEQVLTELSELKKKVELLDARVSSLEGETSAPAFGDEPIDIMLEDEVAFVVPSRKEEFADSLILTSESEDKPKKTRSSAAREESPAPEAKPSEKTYAWHTDTPASPLSNIASGIAMRDRSIFINLLFKENPQLFIDTLTALNSMASLAEAERYLAIKFPEWNLAGDVVYRFMMAVRRKLS